MPNLAVMFLMKSYLVLQIAKFAVSELLRENQEEEGGGGG